MPHFGHFVKNVAIYSTFWQFFSQFWPFFKTEYISGTKSRELSANNLDRKKRFSSSGHFNAQLLVSIIWSTLFENFYPFFSKVWHFSKFYHFFKIITIFFKILTIFWKIKTVKIKLRRIFLISFSFLRVVRVTSNTHTHMLSIWERCVRGMKDK